MKTLLLTANASDINKACVILKNGGLVAIPTETVYGLGANAFDKDASKKIFAAKGRPADNPLIVHIADVSQLKDIVCDVNENAKKLMGKFWPGPLTIVMKKSGKIPLEVTAGLDTVAVRMPSNPVARELLKQCKIPVAAPSANTSGKPSPTSAKHVMDDMNGKIDAVLDGGNCIVGLESTVVDVTDTVPRLLRPGAVTYEDLCSLLGCVEKNYEFKDGETPRSPGVKYKHYSPKAELFIVRNNFFNYVCDNAGKYDKTGVLCHNKYSGFPKNCCVKNMGSTPEEYANTLFSHLRAFDDEGVDVIFAEDIDDKGINLAVKNRLYKVSGSTISRM